MDLEVYKGEQTGAQSFVLYYKKKTTLFNKVQNKFKSWTGGKVEYDLEIYTAIITLLPGAKTIEWEV